ncbi:MAG TPA: DUF2007 domain-containing protein [Acidimicrobiales bacterium]|nr:DUF2007 domain-containing protein [Acidimicrobiales bacterium]
MAIGPMVPLTTAANPFAARVLAAHLGAEGIVWELRGPVDGPYPVGPVEVLVAADDLALARQIVREQDVDPADGDPAGGGGGRGDSAGARAPRELWLLLVVILVAAGVLLGRLLTLVGH